MNLRKASSLLHIAKFRALHATIGRLPGGRISAFGAGPGKIGAILVVNLDRQPTRWRRTQQELGRFLTATGAPLTSITTRFSAVDARDGRAVAATADVDPNYRLGDQLFVQPDPRLADCFEPDEPVRMTRQEVAIARSHIEVWKAIASGQHEHVLVLEDDIWFKAGAGAAIDRGWSAALARARANGGPHLLYLSYEDAGGTADRSAPCDALFQPARGLWFLSGYVLSRDGAKALLRAMPVVGPVDMWINYRFSELGALALSSPVILQRRDCASDNSYSVLPYLARAGVVDASSGPMPPEKPQAGPVLAWTAGGDRESIAMALSILGLRVRAFDGDEAMLSVDQMFDLLDVFDALVDAPLSPAALTAAIRRFDTKFVVEESSAVQGALGLASLPPSRTAVLSLAPSDASWTPLCTLFDLQRPSEPFPAGVSRSLGMFRDGRRETSWVSSDGRQEPRMSLDNSPWVLPAKCDWRPQPMATYQDTQKGAALVHETLTTPTSSFPRMVGTFPGNLASFSNDGLISNEEGTHIILDKISTGGKPYRSGALGSMSSFLHGRFEVEIKAARGPGLVTGFFLHRDAPRQEIDIELTGNDPRTMITNVFFNPGDEGASMAFGYRGAPWRVDLGFDASEDFHVYAIEWHPGRLTWSVDGIVVHERVEWDPTPVPHLPMRLHANLWAPRSEEFAGRVDEKNLPAEAIFRNLSVWDYGKVERRSTACVQPQLPVTALATRLHARLQKDDLPLSGHSG